MNLYLKPFANVVTRTVLGTTWMDWFITAGTLHGRDLWPDTDSAGLRGLLLPLDLYINVIIRL